MGACSGMWLLGLLVAYAVGPALPAPVPEAQGDPTASEAPVKTDASPLSTETISRLLHTEVHDGALEKVEGLVADFLSGRPEMPKLVATCIAANATGMGCNVEAVMWRIVQDFASVPEVSTVINKMRYTTAVSKRPGALLSSPPMALSEVLSGTMPPNFASTHTRAGTQDKKPTAAPTAGAPRPPLSPSASGHGTRPVFTYMGTAATNSTNTSTNTSGTSGTTAAPAPTPTPKRGWWKRVTSDTFETEQYLNSPKTFAHPFNIARDEFTTLTLWAFLWAYSNGEEMGHAQGHAISDKQRGYPHVRDVRKVNGKTLTRFLPWTLETVMPKWRVIKALFSTFDRWYDVYSKETTALRDLGGVKKLCFDFLPSIFEKFSERQMPSLWGKTADMEEIFQLNEDLESVRLLKAKQHYKKGGIKPVVKVGEDSTPTPEDMVDNPYWQKKFKLKHDWERISAYWGCDRTADQSCSPAHDRLPLIFDPKFLNVELPKEDIRTCWIIMENALANYKADDAAFPYFDLKDIKGEPTESGMDKYFSIIGRVITEFVVRKAALPFVNALLVVVTFFLATRYLASAVDQDSAYAEAYAQGPEGDMSTCSATTVLEETEGEGVFCTGVPIDSLGLMRSFNGRCFRYCGKDKGPLLDFRMRTTVSTCTYTGMSPKVTNMIKQNRCESGNNQGDWSRMEMAPLTPTPSPVPGDWDSLSNLPTSYRYLTQDTIDETVRLYCSNADGTRNAEKDSEPECQTYWGNNGDPQASPSPSPVMQESISR